MGVRMNPLVNSSAGSQWTSVSLSSRISSSGSPEDPLTDVALRVSAQGNVAVFQNGITRFSWNVTPADSYETRLSVDVTTREMTVVVNGVTRIGILPTSIRPVMYLSLGAQITTSSQVSTFDDLSVSRIFDFADNFDSANSSVDGGLNDAHMNRRSPFFTDTWLESAPLLKRISGLWNNGPVPGSERSKVNSQQHPGALALTGGASAVMLDTPLSGWSNLIRTTLAPHIGGGADSGDWGSIILCASNECHGFPTNPDTAFAVTIRRNGTVDAYQDGTLKGTSSFNASTSYEVELELLGNKVNVFINGVMWQPSLSRNLPSRVFVALGAEFTTDTHVTKFDDFAIRRTDEYANLSRFGYWGASVGMEEIRGHTNFNMVLNGDFSACGIASCLPYFGHHLFVEHRSPLRPDAYTSVDTFLTTLAPIDSRLFGNYVMDEPFGNGVTPPDFELATEMVESMSPRPTMAILDVKQLDAHIPPPAGLDWVGFDHYCAPAEALEYYLSILEGVTSPSVGLVLVPETTSHIGGCPDANDDQLRANLRVHLDIARRHPRVRAIQGWGMWIPPGQGTVYATATDLPRTTDMLERIGNRIINR